MRDQTFIIPCTRWWEQWYYRIGLGLYDLMAGHLSFGRTKAIPRAEVVAGLGNIRLNGLRGGIVYHDGQFDDARLAIDLARTAVDHGACVLNHAKVTALMKDGTGRVNGVRMHDELSGRSIDVNGRCVVNATGVFTNTILSLDGPDKKDHVVPSQGIHLVLHRSFLPGSAALMIPKTSDGRVLFAIPWHDHVVVGTTDTLVQEPSLEPVPLDEEIAFVLRTAGDHLARKPGPSDVLSMYAGLRPLAAPGKEGQATKEVSRGHKVLISPSGLVSIIGGKWTTYRKMAEDVVDACIRSHGLPVVTCRTSTLPIHGNPDPALRSPQDHLGMYGTEAGVIRALIDADPSLGQRLHPDHPHTVAEVVHALRNEMACTVEDVLARRVRLLFLDARAAMEAAEQVARIMATELGHDEGWVQAQVRSFMAVAQRYLPAGAQG